ncbi:MULTISPECIES: hypothetical protein [Pseudoalteromonas]|uniref:hypothetical protein n=1 Tax=Pseudoalteromonas TaxID=53246 RepID=UPI00101F548C|nr:hypothetical protein [Pseudoalteromonas sp. MEBiC 03485]RZD19666.1 hypothetical protein EVU92_20920 [Pseudoalteromonas sp. MEBiC 03485]
MTLKKYVKDNEAYGVLGDLKQQASFSLSVITSLEKLFARTITQTSVVTKPAFVIYDSNAKNETIMIDGNLITLTPIEQGAIGMLRSSTTRQLDHVSRPIIENAQEIFSTAFYEQFYIKYDWRFGPIYQDFATARVAARS